MIFPLSSLGWWLSRHPRMSIAGFQDLQGSVSSLRLIILRNVASPLKDTGKSVLGGALCIMLLSQGWFA